MKRHFSLHLFSVSLFFLFLSCETSEKAYDVVGENVHAVLDGSIEAYQKTLPAEDLASLPRGPHDLVLQNTSSSQGFLKRKILAFYNVKNGGDIFFSKIHQAAEMPLNYLGMSLIYRSVQDEVLPSDSEMEDVHGVLFWMAGKKKIKRMKEICVWMERQADHGKKIVLLETMHLFRDKNNKMIPECLSLWKKWGIDYLGENAKNTYFMEVADKTSEMVEFERPITFSDPLEYALFRANSDDVKSYLTFRRRDMEDSDSTMVAISPRGGFAVDTHVLLYNEKLKTLNWKINPFLFFAKSFDIENWPRPDVTTLNGSRIFYSHIDGDGIFNVSYIDQKSLSSEIIFNEIVRKYADLPITISYIAGYMDMSIYRSKQAEQLYKNLSSQNNVEIASHTYTHPLIWQKHKQSFDIPGYGYKDEKEIVGSLQLIEDFLGKLGVNKKVKLLQWSGDCRPSAQQLRLANESQILNINGGDSRLDDRYDSYAYVLPIGMNKRGYVQIYASSPNENVYTNLWQGPFYGFRELAQSIWRTDSPIRLKPLNIYYHFYAGERRESLQVLHDLYEIALEAPVVPIFTSEYAQMAFDFYGVRMRRSGESSWNFENLGQLRTIRFDDEKRHVDFEKSKNVLGFFHGENNVLYVHLLPADQADIVLTSDLPSIPYLSRSTAQVLSLEVNQNNEMQMSAVSWNRPWAEIGGLVAGKKYVWKWGSHSQQAEVDTRGILRVQWSLDDLSKGQKQKIEIMPHQTSGAQ